MKQHALAMLRGPAETWRPLPGPQTQAYESKADVMLYGGAAGGGKSDLALGVARLEHFRSLILRRVSPSLRAIIDRSREIYAPGGVEADGDRFTESPIARWRFGDGRQIRFGSVQYDDDVRDYQGQPHDLIIFEELTEFTEHQFRFLSGWNRTTLPGQRCRIIGTCNPPTTPEGEWVIQFWGPWLDPNYPHPAAPGELRWFATVNGKEIEVTDGTPFEADTLAGGREMVYPRSCTFIPAKVQDNPYLVGTGYVATLQALPEPLRSKLLYGDFRAGREDAAYQVIPSEWVRLAQDRWKARAKPSTPMSSLGVDVARGGADRSIYTPRYDNFIDTQIAQPGKATPDGRSVAAQALSLRGERTPVNIDVIGVGTSPYDSLRNGYIDESGEKVAGIGDLAVAMNGSQGSDERDKSGELGFVNKRAEWYWKAREALDPSSGQDIALPPDPELKADLCAPTWKPTPRGIQVEAKEDLIKRLHRSPDKGDSCIYSLAVQTSSFFIV